MLKDEFILMMKQDLKTKYSDKLSSLLICFEEVLKDYPSTTNIDGSKTVEGCYKRMESYAEENQDNGSYVFTPQKTYDFIVNYLELPKISQDNLIVNLDDFI